MQKPQSKPSPPITLDSLICTVGNKDIKTHGVFRIISEDSDFITVDVGGRLLKIDSATMSLNTGSEGLVKFGHHTGIVSASDVVVNSTGAVDITEAKNVDPEKKARVFSVIGANVNVGGIVFTFNAKGYLLGDRDIIQLSQNHTAGFLTHPTKGQVVVAVSNSIAQAIVKTAITENEKLLAMLTVELREFFLESINKQFPNKNGYLNDNNIKSLAHNLHASGDVGELTESEVSMFISIVVNDYDRYVQLYNSRHEQGFAASA